MSAVGSTSQATDQVLARACSLKLLLSIFGPHAIGRGFVARASRRHTRRIRPPRTRHADHRRNRRAARSLSSHRCPAASGVTTTRSGGSRRRTLQGLGRAGRSTCSSRSASHAGEHQSPELCGTGETRADKGRGSRGIIQSEPAKIRMPALEALTSSRRRPRQPRRRAAIRPLPSIRR